MEKKELLHEERYKLAAKRVKQIKGFYSHLLIFVFVNLVIMYINIQNLNEGESYLQWHNFITFAFWGIGLLAHAGSVFLPNLIFGKHWEENKIKEFMDKDDARWE